MPKFTCTVDLLAISKNNQINKIIKHQKFLNYGFFPNPQTQYYKSISLFVALLPPDMCIYIYWLIENPN